MLVLGISWCQVVTMTLGDASLGMDTVFHKCILFSFALLAVSIAEEVWSYRSADRIWGHVSLLWRTRGTGPDLCLQVWNVYWFHSEWYRVLVWNAYLFHPERWRLHMKMSISIGILVCGFLCKLLLFIQMLTLAITSSLNSRSECFTQIF